MDNYIKTRIKIAGKAINIYKMIKAGDRVAVAFSGGLDSLVLIDILTKRLSWLPVTYELLPVHVEIPGIGYELDICKARNFCSERGLSLSVVTAECNTSFDEKSTPCAVCSRSRRNAIFRFATKNRCNRIAFGHHLDDIVESLLMNMVYNGRISTMPPCLDIFNGEMSIIRPLALLTEAEIKSYASISGFEKCISMCRYEKGSSRFFIKNIIEKFSESNPDARMNIFRSMQNIDREYLP